MECNFLSRIFAVGQLANTLRNIYPQSRPTPMFGLANRCEKVRNVHDELQHQHV